MKQFKFKLQPLLSYRQYLERIAQQNTARAILDVKNCENQINNLKKTRDQNTDRIDAIVVDGVKASELRRYHQYLDTVETSIKDEKTRKIELNKFLNERLLELKKKSIEKKAMEIYRETLNARYTQELIKIEQKELDEISSLKTARTLSNENI